MNRQHAVVLALCIAACGKGGEPAEGEDEHERPPIQVRCAAAVSGPRADSVALRGTIEPPPRAQAVIAAPVPGRIARVLVEEGDVVAAGALVAVIEDPSLGASAAASSADVAAAEAELRAATADRTRRENLVGQGISPQKELDEARAREDAARAKVAAAAAQRSLARGNVARAELRAPRSGTVLHLLRRAGEVVDTGAPTIAEIADLSVLELRAQVTGADLVGLAVGATAEVSLDALPGVPIPGELVAVAPALDTATSLGTVRIRITPPATAHLAVGLPGVATVHRTPRVAVTVPPTALRRSIEGRDEVVVCAAAPALHAEVRSITVGTRAPDAAEVVAGLAAGERVIVDHVLTVEDGAPLVETAK